MKKLQIPKTKFQITFKKKKFQIPKAVFWVFGIWYLGFIF